MAMDGVNYVKFIAALALVLALIALCNLLLRRFGTGFAGKLRKADAQLALLESLPLDNRRRLLLVKRGGVAHLILLGASAETVVESNIPLPHISPAPEVVSGQEVTSGPKLKLGPRVKTPSLKVETGDA